VTGAEPDVTLRAVEPSDLDTLFPMMNDPESVRMAAFVSEDFADRERFGALMARVLAAPDVTHRTILSGDQVVGSVASFVVEGDLEVTYWIDRAHWGQGIAGRALQLLLEEVETRPLYGRVVSDNQASLRVLKRNGFRVVGTEVSYAPARGADVEETILRLD
jgi:RimJ/RimL family protein N-acetyltransferase